jgi:hypothetical protein
MFAWWNQGEYNGLACGQEGGEEKEWTQNFWWLNFCKTPTWKTGKEVDAQFRIYLTKWVLMIGFQRNWLSVVTI